MRALLAGLALLLLAPAARAEGDALRRIVVGSLEAEHCRVSRFDTVFRGPLPGAAWTVNVVAFAYENCGGSENWASVMAVFLEEGGEFVLLRFPGERAVPEVVRSVRVAQGRILVEGADYARRDRPCCPSVPRRVGLALRDNRLVPSR